MYKESPVTLLLRTALFTFALLSLVACGGGGSKKNGTPASVGGVGSSLSNNSLSNNSLPINNSSLGSKSSTNNSTPNNNSSRVTNTNSSLAGASSSVLPASAFLMGGTIQGVALNPTTEVSTFAGAALGTDGTAGSARFNFPIGITDDGTHLYIADGNHTIRKVVIDTGEVTTFAGTKDTAGGEDGTGTAAKFKGPNALVVADDFVFVADSGNHTIRRIGRRTGVVTTFAGLKGNLGNNDALTGTAAKFNSPRGICATTLHLFIADTGNHTIRQVVRSTGAVTTLAGLAGSSGSQDGAGATARFKTPIGITTDGTNLFVSDTSNSTIRKIVISSGAVTTLAGTVGVNGSTDGVGSAAQFRTPDSISISTDKTHLFVSDRGNTTLRKIVISSREVTTLAGSAGVSGSTDGTGNAASFRTPRGITIAGSNLYVVDSFNNSVRKIGVDTAEVSTLAGVSASTDGTGAAAHFQVASGMATDGTHLYIADTNSNAIRKIAIDTGAVTTLAGALREPEGSADGTGGEARFSKPLGVTVTNDRTKLYVTDSFNNTIRQIVLETGAVTTFAGTAGVDGSADLTGLAATFNEPNGITTDGPNLYVADTLNHSIRKIEIATQKVTTLAGTPGEKGSDDLPAPGPGLAAKFNEPAGITTDGTHLYVADAFNRTIRKIVINTGAVSTLAGLAGDDTFKDGTGAEARFNQPRGITTDGTYLYVSDNHRIRKIEIASGLVTTLAGSGNGSLDGLGAAATFDNPDGMTSDGFNLYLMDTGNNTVRKIH